VLGVLLLSLTGLGAAEASARIEFAAPEAEANSFQPLRLVIDLPGPPRSVVVRLALPTGARTVRPVDRVDIGGGHPRIYLFNVFIPEGSSAGEFVVTGEVRDDSRVWPLRAALRVRADPRVRIAQQLVDRITVAADQIATNRFTILNKGNIPMTLTFRVRSDPGVRTTIEPAELSIDPGASGVVNVTAQAEMDVKTLYETSVAVSVEGRRDEYVQRKTARFEVVFVPTHPDPGPLFAQLKGEMILGGLVADNSDGSLGFAGRIALVGDITASTRLELSGADGRVSSAGSRTGLADRDYARVALLGRWGLVEGGLITPPSFGLLEPSTQGRGGLAEVPWGDWRVATFATRDAYTDFAREHYGLHARQPDGRWELGLLAQRNELAGSPDEQRFGGYAQWHWLSKDKQIDSSTQLTAAEIDTDTLGVRYGGEQRLRWQGEHLSLDGILQLAEKGFDLEGRSSRESNATVIWRQDPWQWFVRGMDSQDDGELRTDAQERNDAGLPPLPEEILQLSTGDTSRQREVEAGVNRRTNVGQFEFSLAHTEYSTSLDPRSDYRERSGTLGWTRNLPQLFADAEAIVGQEDLGGETTDFAEVSVNFAGQWRDALTYTLNARRDWNWNGFSTGLRRPGLYGQLSLTWQTRPDRWRVETGVDAYAYDGLPSLIRCYAVVEVPINRRLNVGLEFSVENHEGPSNAWVFLRVPLNVPMKWRPTHGALTGRIHSSSGAAVPGVLADLGGRRALTTSDGSFVLPSMPPGRYPLTWRMPGGWTEGKDWPHEVEVRAGQKEFVELNASALTVLRGTVLVQGETAGTEARKPSGAVSITDESGRLFETNVTDGEFQLGLPPGNFKIRFEGSESAAVTEQLQATVTVESGKETAAVSLAATEKSRKLRQTLFEENAAPASLENGGGG
jgi:hypothetical protein